MDFRRPTPTDAFDHQKNETGGRPLSLLTNNEISSINNKLYQSCCELYHIKKFTVPKWLEMTFNKNNKEHKKTKTQNIKVEIPKLILSKHGGAFKSKLKFSNNAILDNDHNNQPTFSYDGTDEATSSSSNNRIKRKSRNKKKTTKVRTERLSTVAAAVSDVSLAGQMKRSHHNLKINTTKDINESNVSTVVYNTSLQIDLQLGPDQPTLRRFEQLHRKYFDKSVQDTVVIINNIVFMNLLANMHCMSRVNNILNMTDKHIMAQTVQNQTTMYIKYVIVLDDLLRKYCIDVISIFENSDYEHALLMFITSLYTGLQTFGSIVFKSGSVILNKLERVQWGGTTDGTVKNVNFDHSRILTTLKSETFCSCYHTLSTLIGQGSKTNPTVVKCWELFVTPAIINMTHFLSTIEAIVNATDIDTVVHLIDEASNNVRLYSHLGNGDNPSSSLNKTKIENLIALVNNSTREESTTDNGQPTGNTYGSVKNKQSMPIRSENISTPRIIHTQNVITSEINSSQDNYPNTRSKDIARISSPSVLQTPIIDPSGHENSQFSIPVTIGNTSTPNIVNDQTLKIPQPNTLYEDFPLTYSSDTPKIPMDRPGPMYRVSNVSNLVSNGNANLYNNCQNSALVQNGNPSTPHIMYTANIKIPQPNTLYEEFPLTYSSDISTTSMNSSMQMCQPRSISNAVPTYSYHNCEGAMSMQNENESTPHIVYAPTLKVPKPNTLYENFPITYSTDIPGISTPNAMQSYASPISTKDTYIHKKFNFTMHRVGNITQNQ